MAGDPACCGPAPCFAQGWKKEEHLILVCKLVLHTGQWAHIWDNNVITAPALPSSIGALGVIVWGIALDSWRRGLRVAANDLDLWSLPVGQRCFLAPWPYQSGWGYRISKEEWVRGSFKPPPAALSLALPRSFQKLWKPHGMWWYWWILLHEFCETFRLCHLSLVQQDWQELWVVPYHLLT